MKGFERVVVRGLLLANIMPKKDFL